MLFTNDILNKICGCLRIQNKKIVFTNGCFDIIHSGHVIYLSEAKKLGDILIVGLNSNDSVRRLKGNSRPINSQSDRAIVLSGLKPVDFITIFEEDTPYNLISMLKPDVLVKGGDYSVEQIVGADIVTGSGGKVVVIPYIEGMSTSKLIERIAGA